MISIQNDDLVKENASLVVELSFLKNNESKNALKKENEDLKVKILNLEKIISKFTLGKEKLDAILFSQRSVYDKAGLGFNPSKKQKTLKIFFVKSSESTSSNITCFHCGGRGHIAYECNLKKSSIHNKVKNTHSRSRKMLVPKGTQGTNPQGPKQIWVPKVKN